MNSRYSYPIANAPSASADMPQDEPADVVHAPTATREKTKPALAVALHYSGRGAPRLTAKGGGVVAQKIIDTARQHGVPLEEDSALAGALARVELGREIPRELWIAVAQVLTFAWTVSGKKRP